MKTPPPWPPKSFKATPAFKIGDRVSVAKIAWSEKRERGTVERIHEKKPWFYVAFDDGNTWCWVEVSHLTRLVKKKKKRREYWVLDDGTGHYPTCYRGEPRWDGEKGENVIHVREVLKPRR